VLGEHSEVIAVSDSSPLHYLIRIGKADLLPRLFDGVVIPFSVRQELECLGAPVVVRQWIEKPPLWATVRNATTMDSSLPLGKGECESISLALELHSGVILLDDKKARRIAQEHGLAVAGTLALLRVAHDRGWAQLPETIRGLRECGFRMSEKLARQMSRDLPDNPRFPSPLP
jgi:predicted nucleic acid-binding protein